MKKISRHLCFQKVYVVVPEGKILAVLHDDRASILKEQIQELWDGIDEEIREVVWAERKYCMC